MMFSLILLLNILVFFSNATKPELNVENVGQYLAEYAQLRSGMFRFMRGGGGDQCYNKYIPKINLISERAQNDTQRCSDIADSRRKDELQKVQEQRNSIDKDIQAIEKSFEQCEAQTEGIDYLKCLKNDADSNVKSMNEIAKASADAFEKVEKNMNSVDKQENKCIIEVINKSKREIDELLTALQRCLFNGFDPATEPEPET